MSYAKQVADRARADLQRRRESISKEIDIRQQEVKEIDAILAGIETGSKSTSPPKRSTPTRKSRAKKTAKKKPAAAPPPPATQSSSPPKKTGRPSHKDRLLRRLGEVTSGTMPRDEIAKFLDTSEQTVSALINDLVRAGEVKIMGDDDDKVALA